MEDKKGNEELKVESLVIRSFDAVTDGDSDLIEVAIGTNAQVDEAVQPTDSQAAPPEITTFRLVVILCGLWVRNTLKTIQGLLG